jgi:hypothetical protein
VTGDSRVAVFDCFSGIAGDMTLAALVDAGANLDAIVAGLARLGLPAFQLSTERVQRSGMRATYLQVEIAEERTYQPPEMRQKVLTAGFPPRVEARAIAAIDALAAAEASVHETPEADFHEVGGVDALIDIVGTMLALEALGVAEAVCPVVTVGSGTIARSAHGAIPAAPGPAAAEILKTSGFPLRFVEAGHELVTPTGAAILAAVARPGTATLTAEAVGAGAGTFDPPGRPNAVRVFIGTRTAPQPLAAMRRLALLEANIDDMPAVFIAHARDRLLEEGALDAWTEPIGMKKGRAATKLCALVPEGDEARIAAVFLRETTTLGVRTTPYARFEAERRFETFESSLGPVRLKVSSWPGGERRTLEFEDVKALAASLNRPAWQVQQQLERELG